MPVTTSDDPNPKLITMKVGERRKIMSKTMMTDISPGVMMGPVDQLRSSDSKIIKIEGHFMGSDAWVKALAPGGADILYRSQEGKITPIYVISNGEKIMAMKRP